MDDVPRMSSPTASPFPPSKRIVFVGPLRAPSPGRSTPSPRDRHCEGDLTVGTPETRGTDGRERGVLGFNSSVPGPPTLHGLVLPGPLPKQEPTLSSNVYPSPRSFSGYGPLSDPLSSFRRRPQRDIHPRRGTRPSGRVNGREYSDNKEVIKLINAYRPASVEGFVEGPTTE